METVNGGVLITRQIGFYSLQRLIGLEIYTPPAPLSENSVYFCKTSFYFIP